MFFIYHYNSEYFVNYLHKDVTLSARTIVWSIAINLFKKNFIVGIGIQSADYLKSILYGVSHPHNLFLSILLTSGIIGFIIYMIIFFMINKNTRNIQNKRVKFIINTSIFVLLFMGLADTIDTGLFFTFYIIAIMYQNIMEQNTN